jgi:O-antigen/teichoic acid export membrane protein
MADPPPTLTARTVSGAAWSAIGRTGQQVVSLVGTAILARLLTPEHYGLVGMASLVTGFILIFRDLGTSAAIIQRPELSDEFVASLFWVNMLFGLAALLAGVLLAPWIAAFYHTPALTPVMSVLSFAFLLSSFGIVPSGLLSRQLAFRKIAFVEIACAAAGMGVAVTMAFRGYGVWSLVVANLTNTTLESALFLSLCSWRPRFLFRLEEVRRIYSFSGNLVGFQTVNFFARHADDILIGRYLGASSLGYYRLAYTLMLYPVQRVTGVLARVLFPALAQVQHDHERFRNAYVRTCVAIGAITFPMMLGLMAVAGPFVEVFFGPRWTPVAGLLTILSLVGLVQSIGSTVGLIYMAKGRTALMFRVGMVMSVILVASFLVGLRWGINGVAAAYATASLGVTLPTLRIACRLIDLPVGRLLKALAPVFGYSLLMLVPVTLVRLVLERLALHQPVFVLATAVATGVVTYATSLFYWRPPFLADLLKLVGGVLPARFGGVVQRWAVR